MVLHETSEYNGWAVGDELPSAFASDRRRSAHDRRDVRRQPDRGSTTWSRWTPTRRYFREQLDTFVLVKLAGGPTRPRCRATSSRPRPEFGNIEVQDQTAFRDQQAGFIDQLLGLVTACCSSPSSSRCSASEHAGPVRLRTHARARAAPRRGHGPHAGEAHDPVGVGDHRHPRAPCSGSRSGSSSDGPCSRRWRPEGITEFVIPVGQLVFFVVFAALAGVVAAIFPARRAAKLNVLEAISYE